MTRATPPSPALGFARLGSLAVPLLGALVIGGVFLWLGGGGETPAEPEGTQTSATDPSPGPEEGPKDPRVAVRLAARQMREAVQRFGDANIATGIAMRALGPVLPRDDARPMLLEWLGDTDPTVRWAGLVLMHRYGPADARLVKLLLRLSYDEDARVAEHALTTIEHLREADDEAARLIERGITRNEGPRKAALLRAFVRCRPRVMRIVPVLVRGLDAPSVRVRRSSAYGLGTRDLTPQEGERYPHGHLVEPLRRALRDEDPEVRMYAAMALSRMLHESRPALPELLNGLEDATSYVPPWMSSAIERMGPDALPAIRERFLEGRHGATPHLVWILRRTASAGGDRVLREGLLHPDPFVRAWAASALVDLDARDEVVLGTLLEGLQGSVARVAILPVASGSSIAGDVATAIDAERERVVRIVSLKAISRLGVAEPRFERWLRALAKHPRASVARAAEVALVPYERNEGSR